MVCYLFLANLGWLACVSRHVSCVPGHVVCRRQCAPWECVKGIGVRYVHRLSHEPHCTQCLHWVCAQRPKCSLTVLDRARVDCVRPQLASGPSWQMAEIRQCHHSDPSCCLFGRSPPGHILVSRCLQSGPLPLAFRPQVWTTDASQLFCRSAYQIRQGDVTHLPRPLKCET